MPAEHTTSSGEMRRRRHSSLLRPTPTRVYESALKANARRAKAVFSANKETTCTRGKYFAGNEHLPAMGGTSVHWKRNSSEPNFYESPASAAIESHVAYLE